MGAAEGVFAPALAGLRSCPTSQVERSQAARFRLAELATELDIARTFVEDCVREHRDGELTAADAPCSTPASRRSTAAPRGS